jgi:hypothetical protein
MNRWMRRILVVLEVGGGTVGLVLLTLSRPWTREMAKGAWFLVALYVCLFLFTIAAGLLLSEGTRRGIKWSAVCQAIQIPVVISSALTYRFFFTTHLTVGSFGSTWVAEYGFGATFMLAGRQVPSFSPLTAGAGWGVNLIAIVAFLYLLWRLHRTPEEAPYTTSEDLGANSAEEPTTAGTRDSVS